MPRVALHTLGCKLNYAESSAIGKQFLDRGFDLVQFGEPADVCVINTCSVTERADRECRQLIRRARRTSPSPFIIVTGCYAQLEPEEVASIRGVDLVLGTNEKFSLFDHIQTFEKRPSPGIVVSDIGSIDRFGPASSMKPGDRTRAYLKIQDGCDYNCSFCTIPLARGGSRSQPLHLCLAQARELVSRGYKEIVLTGVNVGDYGTTSGPDLLALAKELVKVDGLERLRISSIEPNLLSRDIIDFVAGNEKMCRHFHVPLQSGADRILRHMRRRYTADDYAGLIGMLRASIPDCGIGVDVIVGFPGESDEDFQRTHDLLSDLPVSYLHVFTYSERPHTPAAQFSGTVDPGVRHRRNDILRLLGQKKRHAFYEGMIGRTCTVLAEGDVDGDSRHGFTSNYVRVALPAATTFENTLVPVEIVGLEHERCLGRPLERGARS